MGHAVSVVIPTRDRWLHATTAAGCAVGQVDVDVEVIVVDDGSRTPAPPALQALGGRIRLLRHERSGGVSQARNRGLEAAAHPWVAFLDDDDVWSPRHLHGALASAERGGAAWAYAPQIVIDGESRPIMRMPAPAGGDLAAELRAKNVVGGPSAVVCRTELVTAVGGFDRAFAVLADWDLWLRLAERAPAAAAAEATVGYRRHGTNLHLDMDRVLEEMPRLRARHGVENPDFEAWIADGYRTQGARLAAARWYRRSARARSRPRDLARAAGVLLVGRAMGHLGARPEVPDTPGWLRDVRAAELELARQTAR